MSSTGHRLGKRKVTNLEGALLTLAWDTKNHPEVVVMCVCLPMILYFLLTGAYVDLRALQKNAGFITPHHDNDSTLATNKIQISSF